jgi:hypothetical protein
MAENLCAFRPLTQERYSLLLRGGVDPTIAVRLQGTGQLKKNSVTSSETEPGTYQLV